GRGALVFREAYARFRAPPRDGRWHGGVTSFLHTSGCFRTHHLASEKGYVMKFRKSMLSASIATALLFAAAAQAQNASPQNQTNNTDQSQAAKDKQAADKKPTAQTLGTVQVVG